MAPVVSDTPCCYARVRDVKKKKKKKRMHRYRHAHIGELASSTTGIVDKVDWF
jgi:hypothetical protein